MKTITLLKQWETEYAEAPEAMKLKFSEKDIESLKKHIEYAKENKVNVEYPFYNATLFNNEDCEDESDFRQEAEGIKITELGNLYYTAVCKYDYSLSFESEVFTLEDLNGVFLNNDLQWDIQRLKTIESPATAVKSQDSNLENQYAIDLEDTSYWYANEKDRDEDFKKLKEALTQFTFV